MIVHIPALNETPCFRTVPKKGAIRHRIKKVRTEKSVIFQQIPEIWDEVILA